MFVAIGWRRVHKDASQRDLENWRRTTVATRVADLIADTEAMVSEELDVYDTEQMRSVYQKMAALDRHLTILTACSVSVSKQADIYIELAKKYKNSISSKHPVEPEIQKALGMQLMTERALLVDRMAKSIKLNELDGII